MRRFFIFLGRKLICIAELDPSALQVIDREQGLFFYYQVRNCANAIPLTLKLVTQAEAQAKVVCYTAVLSVAPPRVLRDDTKNGCVAD